MTQYTIYATAANTVGNIVTVNSVGNMFSGLPIVFSGNTFGNITAGATYYIGAVIPGYPASTITLSSLPGGAVYAVSNATGNMTAVFSSGGQQIINTVPPGESLTTAFTAVNVNFDQLFAAGPVNSNIQIANNTVLTTNTNGNINLVPNGIGAVVVNSSVIPDTANIRNLGSVNNRFSTIYAQYYNMSGNLLTNNISTGNIVATGTITGPTIITNTIQSDDSSFVTVNDGLNVEDMLTVAGNATADYFIGNGSQLTGISASSNKIYNGNSYANIATADGNLVVNVGTDGYGTWTFETGTGNLIGPGNVSQGAGIVFSADQSVYIREDQGQLNIDAGSHTVITSNSGNIGNTQSWDFGANGNLTAPGNIRMSNIGGIYSTTSGYTVGLKMSNTEPSVKLVAHNHEWQFNSDGVLKFPAGYSTTYPSITMGEPGNLLIQGYINGNYTEDGGNVIVSGGFGDGNNGNATVLGQQVIVQAQLSTTNGSPTYSWTFDATGNLNAPGNISATGNVIANIFSTSGPSGNITGANVISATTISASGNVTGDFILGNIAFANGIPATYSNSNVESLLSAFGTNTISTTGNVSGGNFTLAGDTILNNVTDTITLQTGGDSWTFGTNGTLTAPGNISTTGNITTSGNFVGNGATLSNVATQFKSTWTVTAGTGDYSFGVPANDTYQLWVRGNIPNGIIVYTATVALSNTNVPVLGVQYGWNYIAGGNLILNSLPSQFVGTAGAISNAAPTVTNTDVFTFNITNNSGASQTVYYGWTKIS